MWFKNIQLYTLGETLAYDPEAFAAELAAVPFVPCGRLVAESAGFVPPVGDADAPLVYGSQGMMVCCLKIQSKVLPPAVLNEQLAEQMKQRESTLGRKLFADEKKSMKEDLYQTLIGQAFSKSQRVYAIIDTKKQRLILDTTTSKTLDIFMSRLNRVLPDQKIQLPALISPPAIMTQWLHNKQLPAALALADACVLSDGDERQGIVRFSRKDLGSEAVQRLLNDGNQVTQLAISWRSQLLCQIRKDFAFTGVKFSDTVKDMARDSLSETPEARFAADFLLMAETIGQFLDDILPCFSEPSFAAATENETVTA